MTAMTKSNRHWTDSVLADCRWMHATEFNGNKCNCICDSVTINGIRFSIHFCFRRFFLSSSFFSHFFSVWSWCTFCRKRTWSPAAIYRKKYVEHVPFNKNSHWLAVQRTSFEKSIDASFSHSHMHSKQWMLINELMLSVDCWQRFLCVSVCWFSVDTKTCDDWSRQMSSTLN